MRRLGYMVVGIVAFACRGRAADQDSVDTVMVFRAPPPAAPDSPVLRVAVLNDASIVADGRVVTLAALDSLFDRLQASNGQVWLYHDGASPRGSEPELTWRQVASRVARRGLPNTHSRRSDFADLLESH